MGWGWTPWEYIATPRGASSLFAIGSSAFAPIRAALQRSKRISGFIPLAGRIPAIIIVQVVLSDESGTPQGYIMMAEELGAKEVSAALQAPVAIRLGAAAPLLAQGDKAWRIAVPVRSAAHRPTWRRRGLPHLRLHATS